MTAGTQTLCDDVLAVFKRACEQEQYVAADLLLRSLEAMAGPAQDSRQLDEAYLVVARCCAPPSRCAAWDSAPAQQISASYTEGIQGQTAPTSGRTSGTRV